MVVVSARLFAVRARGQSVICLSGYIVGPLIFVVCVACCLFLFLPAPAVIAAVIVAVLAAVIAAFIAGIAVLLLLGDDLN